MKNAEINAQRLLLLGILSELPAEDQVEVREAMAAIRQEVSNFGDHGVFALSLVALEMAKEA